MTRAALTRLTLLTLLAGAACAQDDSAEIDRLVREGAVDQVVAHYKGVETPEAFRAIAQAQANRASRAKDPAERSTEFQKAEQRYNEWIRKVEANTSLEPTRRAVEAAIARSELINMMIGQWAARDLDDYELSNGTRGDEKRLLEILRKAALRADEAWALIKPMAERLEKDPASAEDEFLALGVYEQLQRLSQELRFQLGWSNLYAAGVYSIPARERSERLLAAERSFLGLLSAGQSGDTLARCGLGLGLTLRELERFDEARRYLDTAQASATQPRLSAQIRYERARNELRAGRFDEARALLRPLVAKDPERLSPEDRPARFYLNLARLWDANSYLLEAQRLQGAQDAESRQKADKARDMGLLRMYRLAEQGGPWPDLVQTYVAPVLPNPLDAAKATPAELLFAARDLARRERPREALELLQSAAQRGDVSAQMSGEILQELGSAQIQAGQRALGAQTLMKFAQARPDDPKAPEAMRLACLALARQAEIESDPEIYAQLAGACRTLLSAYPKHPARDDVQWWLCIALQAAGQPAEAAAAFRAIPEGSKHYTEARYRGVMAAREALGGAGPSLPPGEFKSRANELIAQLKKLADSPPGQTDQRWAASALLAAAELQCDEPLGAYEDALATLDEFARRFPDGKLEARELAARIAALRGLKRFEDAAAAVERFMSRTRGDRAGGVLAGLARSLQEEVDQLRKSGDAGGARALARTALPVFEELEKWIQADATRRRHAEAARFGRAQMCYFAGEQAEAAQLLDALIAANPRDGRYLSLYAKTLSASLGKDASLAEVGAARDAWRRLLRDSGLHAAAPELYWEARYELLRLTLRGGEAATVEEAIRQEQVWRPDLGGPEWRPRFEALYEQAAGRPLESQPAPSAP